MSEIETTLGNVEVGEKKLNVTVNVQDIVKVTDRGGHSIHYQLVGGVYYTLLMKTNLIKEARRFQLRPDDIYFTGYVRTGTHWTFERVSMLLNGEVETIPRFKDHIENVTPEEFDKLPSPRVINSHLRLSDSPDDVGVKKVKVIYTLRDPKDAAVSLYEAYYGTSFYGGSYMGSFKDFLHLFLTGQVVINDIFGHWRDAEKFFGDNPEVPVHFEIYEESIKDPVKAVKKLSDFLGLPQNDDLCQAIAEKCDFRRMKVDKDKYALKVDGENILYRKGTVGDWRNYFTDGMLDYYYRVYDEKMTGSRFYHLYTRDKD